MIKFKQLFCSHIYKETKIESLMKYRARCITVYINYEEFAHYYTCVKCGKQKIEATRKIIS